jgi:hypothetical protein
MPVYGWLGFMVEINIKIVLPEELMIYIKEIITVKTNKKARAIQIF